MNKKHLKFIFLLLSFLLPSCSLSTTKEFKQVSLQNLSGHSFKQSEITNLNQPILYFFIASWCPKCRSEIQALEKFYKSNNFANLTVLVVAIDDSLENLSLFKSTFHLTMPIYLDYSRDLQARFNIQSIPQTVLVANDGKVLPILDINTKRELEAIKGVRDWNSKLFKNWLERQTGF